MNKFLHLKLGTLRNQIPYFEQALALAWLILLVLHGILPVAMSSTGLCAWKGKHSICAAMPKPTPMAPSRRKTSSEK